MRVDEAVRRQELSLCKKKEEDCGMKKCMFMFCSEGKFNEREAVPRQGEILRVSMLSRHRSFAKKLCNSKEDMVTRRRRNYTKLSVP